MEPEPWSLEGRDIQNFDEPDETDRSTCNESEYGYDDESEQEPEPEPVCLRRRVGRSYVQYATILQEDLDFLPEARVKCQSAL